MSDTKFGTFDDLVEITPPTQRPIMQRLRQIIQALDPAVCEVVRLGDRAATYGLGPKKMSEGYAYLSPNESWVNLGFFKGTDLPDPAGVMEGTGAKMRHVKIRSLAEAERPLIEALIRAALAERKHSLGR
jgi:hypothetical protein